jgi:hypothetical protein
MSSSDPRPFLDKLVGVCLSVLIGAAAIYIAVRLIQAVWTALLVILGVGAFLAIAAALLHSRNRDW